MRNNTHKKLLLTTAGKILRFVLSFSLALCLWVNEILCIYVQALAFFSAIYIMLVMLRIFVHLYDIFLFIFFWSLSKGRNVKDVSFRWLFQWFTDLLIFNVIFSTASVSLYLCTYCKEIDCGQKHLSRINSITTSKEAIQRSITKINLNIIHKKRFT